ncbi:HSP20-like chaperone [Penicillium bovifimosum]|uniref:HSP20-like chaperone n=1 Tax=Penicillium bovifimosum TaxID=126998 RepID=A0A9W9GHW8_9EURO|nr:HSP20-like chaperone [Penicillium bovifimosum]KAJ5120535.1 HSP20-like chaperone [Penicillium bovifimosum]
MSLLRASFPRTGDFAPLFRLLDDYDAHRSSGNHTAARAFSPRFDVRESEKAFHFDGELPGIAQKDIDVEFPDPQTMVIKGRVVREYHTPEPQAEAKEGAEQAEDNQVTKNKSGHRFWASERSVGEFQRSFTFPSRVDPDKTSANLKNGILSIEVPKATAAASKKITIG